MAHQNCNVAADTFIDDDVAVVSTNKAGGGSLPPGGFIAWQFGPLKLLNLGAPYAQFSAFSFWSY